MASASLQNGWGTLGLATCASPRGRQGGLRPAEQTARLTLIHQVLGGHPGRRLRRLPQGVHECARQELECSSLLAPPCPRAALVLRRSPSLCRVRSANHLGGVDRRLRLLPLGRCGEAEVCRNLPVINASGAVTPAAWGAAERYHALPLLRRRRRQPRKAARGAQHVFATPPRRGGASDRATAPGEGAADRHYPLLRLRRELRRWQSATVSEGAAGLHNPPSRRGASGGGTALGGKGQRQSVQHALLRL